MKKKSSMILTSIIIYSIITCTCVALIVLGKKIKHLEIEKITPLLEV